MGGQREENLARPPASRKWSRSPGWRRAETQRPPACGSPRGGDLEAATGGAGRDGTAGSSCRPCTQGWPAGPLERQTRSRARSASLFLSVACSPPTPSRSPRGPGHPVHVAPGHGKGLDAYFKTDTPPLGQLRTRASGQNSGPLSCCPFLRRGAIRLGLESAIQNRPPLNVRVPPRRQDAGDPRRHLAAHAPTPALCGLRAPAPALPSVNTQIPGQASPCGLSPMETPTAKGPNVSPLRGCRPTGCQ